MDGISEAMWAGGADGDPANANRSPAKAFASKYRPVMMRPMTTAVSKAQDEFKPFVTDAADIDHNMYGKFLGILKDAGVPWKARRLPESREDAMHIMNSMVAAINAYQHYQRDVEKAYHDIESSMAVTSTRTNNQQADLSKLQNEVAMLRRKLAGTENTHAKEGNSLKEQVANLKSKLAQTERDLNDSNIHARKLERLLQQEKKHSDNLMMKIMSADKPKFGKAARAAQRQAAGGFPANGGSLDAMPVTPDMPRRNGGSMIPSVRGSKEARSPLPWLDNDEEALDRPAPRHEFRAVQDVALDLRRHSASGPLESEPIAPCDQGAHTAAAENGARAGVVVHRVQVTAGSPESVSEASGTSEEALEEADPSGHDNGVKTKGRFKKFLKKFRMNSTKTKDSLGKERSGSTASTGKLSLPGGNGKIGSES